jgi:hypothetical protein
VQPSNTFLTATAPPQNEAPNQAQPQSQPQTQNQTESTAAAGALTIEQMRMAGALAARRQKAKLALSKRL